MNGGNGFRISGIGANGFRIQGVNERDTSGGSVSSAGDINGDGFDDLVIGAPLAGPGGNSAAGVSYVIFGKATSDGNEVSGIPNADSMLLGIETWIQSAVWLAAMFLQERMETTFCMGQWIRSAHRWERI